jgi:hypothetical protein
MCGFIEQKPGRIDPLGLGRVASYRLAAQDRQRPECLVLRQDRLRIRVEAISPQDPENLGKIFKVYVGAVWVITNQRGETVDGIL